MKSQFLSRASRRWYASTAVLVIVSMIGARGAHAVPFSFTMTLPDVTVYSDGVTSASGFLEVTLSFTGTPPNIAAYNVDFEVAQMSFVAFGSPTATTVDAAPMFDPFDNSNVGMSTAQHVRAYADKNSSVPIGVAPFGGAGLVRVPFTVSAGQLGTFAVTFGSENQITGADATPYTPNFVGGSITVLSAVPEAAAWQLVTATAIVTAVLAAGTRRRRRGAI